MYVCYENVCYEFTDFNVVTHIKSLTVYFV